MNDIFYSIRNARYRTVSRTVSPNLAKLLKNVEVSGLCHGLRQDQSWGFLANMQLFEWEIFFLIIILHLGDIFSKNKL